jgi:hypothetical protein
MATTDTTALPMSNGATKVAPKPAAKSATVRKTAVAKKPVATKVAAAKTLAAVKKTAAVKKPAVVKKPVAAKKVVSAKPVAKKAVAKVAKPIKANVVPKVVVKETAAPKVKKAKLVRDSFSMPEAEYAVLGAVKKACLKAGIEVKKSELLRIGVALIQKMDVSALKGVLATLPPLKAGRPKQVK